MTHLYVTNNGSIVGIKGGRFQIEQKGDLIRTIPKESVESISIFGNSTITTPCMQYLLESRIPVCFFSGTGRYYGRLESTSMNKMEVIKKQITSFDDKHYALSLTKKSLAAKVNNQNVVLKRYIKTVTPELNRSVALIKVYMKKIEGAETVNEIMGYEGIAARTYFDALSCIIEPEFAFHGRTRRPPRDKFNSLLSLGYTLLMYEVYAKICTEKLTPYYSFLHTVRENHPVLASDMMEEWRAVIVDSLVLSMIQGHEIRSEDFESGDGEGIYLTNTGLKKFIAKFEKKLNTEIRYLQYENKSYSMRDAIGVQCRKIRESVLSADSDVYLPVKIK